MNLPNLVEFNGNIANVSEWNEYINKIYDIFKKTVAQANLSFLNLPIKCAYHVPYDDKHYSFWHTITEAAVRSKKESDRTPDLRRCERIEWISHLIKNSSNFSDVLCWEKKVKTKRGPKNHIQLYLPKERYLVILRRKPDRLELATAYIIVEDNRHDRLIEESKSHPDPRTDKGRS